MVAEPCVVPYTGNSHIGSRDRCEELDGAASTMFRQMNLEESPMSDLGVFTLSSDEAEYINSVLDSEAMTWLNRIDPDRVARSTNAIPPRDDSRNSQGGEER